MQKLIRISLAIVANFVLVGTSYSSEDDSKKEESFLSSMWRALTTTATTSETGQYSDGSLPGESLSDTARRKADEQDWPHKHDNWGNRIEK